MKAKTWGNFGGVNTRVKLTEFVTEPAMAGNWPVLCVCVCVLGHSRSAQMARQHHLALSDSLNHSKGSSDHLACSPS